MKENSSSNKNGGNVDDDLVEILNLDNNNILKLPSPHKFHKNLRSF